MSLEYAFERFPLKVTLREGTNCAIRPLKQLGFRELVRLHDYVVMARRLWGEQEFAGVG